MNETKWATFAAWEKNMRQGRREHETHVEHIYQACPEKTQT